MKKVNFKKEIEGKTLILWFLGIMLVFQATAFLTLKLQIRNRYEESRTEQEELSKEVRRMIEEEVGNEK